MSEPMSDDRLQEIRAREQAATDGPWWFDEDETTWRLHGVHAMLPGPFGDQVVNHQILKAPKKGTPYAEYWPNEADGAFIVHSRQDVKDLLALVDRLRAAVDLLGRHLQGESLDLVELAAENARLRAELAEREAHDAPIAAIAQGMREGKR